MPPIKFNENDTERILNQVPIIEKFKDANENEAIESMMSNIVIEKRKMKFTSVMDMIGVLTPVEYYQIIADASNNYAVDANSPSDIALNNLKFNHITDFKVKLEGQVNLENEGDEQVKSFMSTGTLIILPRTIQPNENDMFIMEYRDRKITYRITTVTVESFSEGPGYKCEYAMHHENSDILDINIIKKYRFVQEFISTTYRTVLLEEEYTNIKNFEKLYNHLSSVFNSLFYDKEINGYMYKVYEENRLRFYSKDNNNINTLGSHNGHFRGNTDLPNSSTPIQPLEVKHQNQAYDNFLISFMQKNRVFRDYDSLLLSVEPLFELDRVSYKRSIYGCVESRSISNYKNIMVLPVPIDYYQLGISSYFVGKKNIIHSEKSIAGSEKSNEPKFPESLINQMKLGKNLDMNLSMRDTVYSSIDDLIIETIIRYVYKKSDDFIDRFQYLYDNLDNLYEHNISYANIYYLFPLLGYIIEQTLREMYKIK